MEKYVVRYHPEGWMSVKEDGLPGESGRYVVAVQTKMDKDWDEGLKEEFGEHFYDYVTSAFYREASKMWVIDEDNCLNALITEPTSDIYVVTYWQPLPTAPWDIFPKGVIDV